MNKMMKDNGKENDKIWYKYKKWQKIQKQYKKIVKDMIKMIMKMTKHIINHIRN